jgi:hypothetical protein
MRRPICFPLLLPLALTASCGSENNDLFDPGGAAGVGGSADAATGGAAGKAGSAGKGGQDASVGGSAGTGGAVVPEAGPDAPPDASCPTNTKPCQGLCVAIADPAVGCAAQSCDPCSVVHGVPECISGACAIGSCVSGYADCNAVFSDGCEVSTSSDVLHCGACNKPCSSGNATTACSQGACKIISCNPGMGDCDKDASNGCETNLAASPLHCGACGIACSFPNAAGACTASVCGLGACNPGFGNCNANPSDGCETGLTDNALHCSACNTQCVFPNATAACSNAQCVIGACAAGFGNCDGIVGNGCEVKVSSDANNCGVCGKTCAGFPCVNGQCQSPPLPVKLADSGGGAFDIAVDATYVYWGSSAGIQRIAKSGGSPTVLSSGVANGIAIDSARAYWADTGASSIRSVPLGGGTATTLVSGLTYPWRVATNGVNVFFTDNSAASVSRVPAMGGAATALATGLGGAAGIAVDASYVYFTTNTSGTVARVPIGGGAVTTLASGESTPIRVAIDATQVYFTTYTSAGAVKKVPIAGGNVVTLAQATSPIAVLVDTGWVYWTDATTVKKMPVAGGNEVILASGQGSPNCLAADSSRIYWVNFTGLAIMASGK